jgi:hypothetical protein
MRIITRDDKWIMPNRFCNSPYRCALEGPLKRVPDDR